MLFASIIFMLTITGLIDSEHYKSSSSAGDAGEGVAVMYLHAINLIFSPTKMPVKARLGPFTIVWQRTINRISGNYSDDISKKMCSAEGHIDKQDYEVNITRWTNVKSTGWTKYMNKQAA